MLSILILSVLLLWSIVVVLQKLLPQQTQALQQYIATRHLTAWPRLAAWLMPKTNSGCAGGCDCPASSTQNSVAKSATKVVPAQPVQWR